MQQVKKVIRNPEPGLQFDSQEWLLKAALARIGEEASFDTFQCNTPIMRFLARAHSRFGLMMPSHRPGFESAFDSALKKAVHFFKTHSCSNAETRRGGFIYTFITELANATIFWQMSYEHDNQRKSLDLAKRNPFAEIAGTIAFHHVPTDVLQTHFFYNAYLQLLNSISSNLDVLAVKNYLVFDRH